MIDTLLTEACVIVRRAATVERDEYNDLILGETRTDARGYAEWTTAREKVDGMDVLGASWRVFLPAGTALDGIDAIEVDDLVIEVRGEPWRVFNPRTGQESHVECVGESNR